MNTTIEVRRIVEFIACSTSGHVRRRCSAARTIAPTAPIAPASVGVASPSPMVPSTRKISTNHPPQHTVDELPGQRLAYTLGQRRHRVRTYDREPNHVEQEN